MRKARGMIRSPGEAASIDLGPSTDLDAESILGWSDRFIGSLKARLLAVRAASKLSADDLVDLEDHGLLDPVSGRPTTLGEDLIELVVREGWQEGAERRSFREMGIGDGVGSVLEVGCSSGWALRSLGPATGGRRLGIDIDATALALGYRFSRIENQDCDFTRASAHSLPLDDESIDLVICRNALTYLHQRTALHEMSRVLKSDGRVFLRFENIWYDLWQISHAKTIRSLGLRLRDFGLGLIHAAIGWQPSEGSRWRPGRVCATVPRLLRTLREHDCEIVQIDESLRCPRLWGFSTQTSVLARKAGDS